MKKIMKFPHLLLNVLLLSSLFFINTAWAEEEETGAEAEEKPKETIAYVSLGDAMVLNLASTGKTRFVQFKADILVTGSDGETDVKNHLAAVRHALIMSYSGQTVENMRSAQSREEIRVAAVAKVKTLIEELSGNSGVENILFSSFLVQ